MFEAVERIDGWLSPHLGGSLWVSALILALLGLRHATDPDHLLAVTQLLEAPGRNLRRAGWLGAAWGAGHALSLLVVGIPMIWLKWALPEEVVIWCERLIGLVIIGLAVGHLVRWSRRRPSHPPVPDHRPARTPLGALAIGSLHGLAGAAGVVLLVALASRTPWQAIGFLLLFAPMTALSMVLCTVGFSWMLRRWRLPAMGVPVVSLFSLAFGVWYVAAAQ